jgi:hypothetical protein
MRLLTVGAEMAAIVPMRWGGDELMLKSSEACSDSPPCAQSRPRLDPRFDWRLDQMCDTTASRVIW